MKRDLMDIIILKVKLPKDSVKEFREKLLRFENFCEKEGYFVKASKEKYPENKTTNYPGGDPINLAVTGITLDNFHNFFEKNIKRIGLENQVIYTNNSAYQFIESLEETYC